MSSVTFFDIETTTDGKKVVDIGAFRSDGNSFHKNSTSDFLDFSKSSDFLCGHNIIRHDLEIIQRQIGNPIFGLDNSIDTLLFSALLFPLKPYHRLLKDDKLHPDERNNPYNDALKSKELFIDEVGAFGKLSENLKTIYYNLLKNKKGFAPFFRFVKFSKDLTADILEKVIQTEIGSKICSNAGLAHFILEFPESLAYAVSIINCSDRYSITPPWVLKQYPDVERILFLLSNNPCLKGCNYCNEAFNPFPALKTYFGFDGFRKYDGEPLQERAVNAALQNKSLVCIFPTGGGKSITFQLPALMAGRNARALTVIISPLQSLMKDQVDNLENKHITEAATINGLLDPIERSKAIERVEDGSVSLLYISPESLRSVTIERLLLKRKIARFVIDEAHCFSAWGQDFRVDYLYIGDFIKKLQEAKNLEDPIPVSCFTATAKQKVIEDIRDYFKDKLKLTLELYRSNASRTNLHYRVFQKDNEEDKYNQLRAIIESKDCPTIVYVSRTKRAYSLAKRLSDDGFSAKPYHGKMDKEEKTSNQNSFMSGDTNIMVATSAFGMGVDKSDVGAVIHYDISDSLENYIQEAGRAGRDEKIEADCYVLFNEEDLDKHFILLNQTKISSKEINQIWKAIKDLSRGKERVSNSALEIARKAGWDDSITEIETRVIIAIAALEDAKYLKRGQNMPRIYASSILSKTAQEAINVINTSQKIEASLKQDATRIIKKLFSSKSKRLSTEEAAESRVDYISDQLGIVKERVIRIIELLREEQVLAQTKDLTAFIKKGESSNRSLAIAESFRKIEDYLFSEIKDGGKTHHLKEINEKAASLGIKDCSPVKIKTLINFWAIKNWIKRQYPDYSRQHLQVALTIPEKDFSMKLEKRHQLARMITEYLYKKASETTSKDPGENILIEFSVLELKEMAGTQQGLFGFTPSLDDIEDSLFYLSRIESIKIEGGFLVVHNRLSIDRVEMNNSIQYKKSDYEKLDQFYQQKVQQIHIVGEYAKKMIRNYNEALQFVDDYFGLNYSSFLRRYFPGSRQTEIKRTLTPEKFKKLFGELSVNQLEIINDVDHQYIVVLAGPGSGKTRVLVHKLASLLLAEDVKHDQLLMLTFSRAAATEFKKRLMELIHNAAAFIDIKTFHSYCFDLLGRVGSLSGSEEIVKSAAEKINSGDIEINRITKTVLVVDEAQDMNADEYSLVKALMDRNEEMRVILVGDDDQNIYEFRKATSMYMQELIEEKGAKKYEMTENYRSSANIVDFANQWAETIDMRLKSQPGFAKNEKNGKVSITEYGSNNLVVPLVNSITAKGLTGSSCILTTTNQEAGLVTGLLIKKGLHAKLIQSNDDFNLNYLYEIRYFNSLLQLDIDFPIINNEDWLAAKQKLTEHIKNGNKSEMILSILNEFEAVNEQRKYKSDWKAYIYESKLEDFIRINNEIIYVSTIHKAKGKEFDNVFVLLKDFKLDSNESRRQLYVAVTRAKNNLQLHYNSSFLRILKVDDLVYKQDKNAYTEPDCITYPLTHKNVKLGYFGYVQHRLNGLQSGQELIVLADGLGLANGQQVLKYSNSFMENLESQARKGYRVKSANVNFVVYWKNEETELKIILPEICLEKVE